MILKFFVWFSRKSFVSHVFGYSSSQFQMCLLALYTDDLFFEFCIIRINGFLKRFAYMSYEQLEL